MQKKYLLKKIIVAAFLLIGVVSLSSNKNDDRERNVGDINKTLLVKIYTEGDAIKKLSKLGVAVDHVEIDKTDNTAIAYLNGYEVGIMKNAGIGYEIVYGDWYDDYYSKLPKITDSELQFQRNAMEERDNVTSFGLGSMGGFYTYDEVIRKLDSMRLNYPNLISAKFQIGTTYTGNPIWAYHVTKDPDVANSRPQVLYTSLIHSREAVTVMNLMYYTYYLLENYSTDECVKYLVDNRDMYFIPFVNPDGYRYNQKFRPNGGGMRRKNLRDVDTVTYQPSANGIDLNRNFGIYQFWNSSNGGSSTSPLSDTYRGTAPFSEPETQTIMNFVNSKNFVNCLFYHSFSNLYIYPWAWSDPQQTPDSVYFQSFSNFMSGYNNYQPGTASQTVGYEVRGGSDDWMYNDSGHTKVLSITPEIGNSGDGFWPQQNRILPLVMENLKPNIFYAGVADTFALYDGYSLLANQSLDGGDTARFYVNVRSVGVKNASNVSASISPLDSFITVLDNDKSFGSFSFFEVKNNSSSPFVIKIKDNTPNGQKSKMLVSVKLGGNTICKDTIYITLGTPTIVFKDTVSSVSPLWTASGPNSNNKWATTTSEFTSAPLSYTDSPFGNYGSNVTNILTLNNGIPLNGLSGLRLQFKTKFKLESGYDYGQVDISTNNGSSWIALGGKFTKSGSGSFQPAGEPVYDGSVANWVQEEIDLSAYSSQTIKLRFYFRSDGFQNRDGWYVDDICIVGYDLQTGITGNGEIPVRYDLSQNYPNPFNPSTTIKYSLAGDSKVSISVFDLLGREVASLVNRVEQAGAYSISFDGRSLASGVYYYRIEAINNASGEVFLETRRMVLMK